MKVLKFVWTLAALVSLQQAIAESTVVPEYAVTGDAEIRVESGDVQRIEYLSGSATATLTKTGGGTLEIAVIGDANVSFVVAEGTLKSARPGKLRAIAGLYYHVDASDTTGMTIESKNGTNYVSRWGDVDGRESYAASKASQTKKPFLVPLSLNGLATMDFGGFISTESVSWQSETSTYMDWGAKKFVRDSFWVWKDHEGLKDISSPSGADFYGPSPVLLGAAVYRGKGGNGREFLFAYTGPREKILAEAYVDGVKLTSQTGVRIGEGWHMANYRMSGEQIDSDEGNYGGESFGRRTYTPPTGGFRLAEAIFSTEILSDADYAYVNAYLNSKWFAPKLGNVTVAGGATLDVSAATWRIDRLQVCDEDGIAGLGNLRVMETCFTNNTMLSAGSRYEAVDFLESATPNLSFAADGEIAVASGTARGNIVDATGVLTKSGEGGFETSYLTEGVSGIAVTGGSFTLSPLLSAESALHFDAAQFVTTEETAGKALVTNWGDVNVGRGSSLGKLDGNYKFKQSSVNLPYLVENATSGGLPLVDFGSFADQNHPDGWGAALLPTKPLAGGKSALATCNGWLQGFAVWQDDDAAKDLPLVDGNAFVGPCLFGINYSWMRGKGGGGTGFPLTSGGSADFTANLKIDGERLSAADAKANPIAPGLHLFDSEPGTVDGMSGVQMVGAKREAANTAYFGGVKFGEFMFFRHRIPAGQRTKIAAALGVKWFGTDKWKLEQVFGSLSVADGASASFPYADVTVTNLTASGSVSARSLTVADGGKLIVDATDRVLTADGVSFAGKGTIVLNADVGSTIAEPIKVIAATDGPATPQKVPGWRTKTGVKAVLVRRADGYYLDPAPGLMLIFR